MPALRLRGVGRRFGGVQAVRGRRSRRPRTASAARSSARTGPARRRSSTSSRATSRRASGTIEVLGTDVTALPPRVAPGARPLPQLPEVPSLRRAHGARQPLPRAARQARRAPPVVPRPRRRRAARARATRRRPGRARRRARHAASASLSHGEQRQLEVAMAQVTDPEVIMLDEPASGLSRGERERLTELLLAIPRDVTLILIEHDMDVALHVAEYVTMMHDGHKIVEGTPAEIRANETVHDLYLGSRHYEMSDTLFEIEDLDAYYGQAQVLEGVSLAMGTEGVAVIGRNGMGKTTLCASIMGMMPPRDGLDPLPRPELLGRAVLQDRRARDRLRAAGPAALPVALGRRAPADARAGHARQALDARRRLRALPAPRRAQAQRRHPALGRRAADARDRPRAPRQPRAPDHGRAVRGPRADDRRGHDRDLQDARRGGDGDPARGAEPRRRDVDRRAAARDGRGPDRGRDDRGGARRATPTRSAGTSASSRSRPDRRRCLCRPSSSSGTLDTKGHEYAFLADRIREHGVDVAARRRGDRRRAARAART